MAEEKSNKEAAEEALAVMERADGSAWRTFARRIRARLAELEAEQVERLGHYGISRDKQIAELEAQAPRWISVAERLPDDAGFYLVWPDWSPRSIDIAFWDIGEWWEQYQPGHPFGPKVIHWQPLPSPPKEAS